MLETRKVHYIYAILLLFQWFRHYFYKKNMYIAFLGYIYILLSDQVS